MSILEAVRKHKIIVILRGIPCEKVVDTAVALYKGGIRLLEITFDQSSGTKLADTAESIRKVKEHMGDRMMIGAGTVLTEEEVHAACEAGAAFLLSPSVDEGVIRCGKSLGMGVIPGALTPTEISNAHRFGADMVKVFPVGNMGTDYLKAVKAPLSHIPLLAVGGVEIENMREILVVADGVGIGSSIANAKLISENRYEELTALTLKFTSLL